MKKTKLFLVCCFYMVTNTMFCDTFTVDGITYKTLTTTTVQASSYETLPSVDITIPSQVKNKGKNYQVVKIGNDAFSKCVKLVSVTIEEGVTEIGNSAYHGCYNLKKVTLPEGLKTLGLSAFSNCDNLVSINLPSTLTEIGSNCFGVCRNLQSDMIVPSGVSKIESDTFSGCNRITKIRLPETITEIGEDAFRSCEELKDINIPPSVQIIGERAFQDCYKIKTITIPDGITQIESDLFSGCSSLKSVHIPTSVQSIGSWAFTGCSSLTSVSIPDNVLSINDFTFQGCTNLQSVNISSNSHMLTIGSCAFRYCSSLTSIYIPKGVDLVNDNSIQGCTSLASYNVHPQNNTYCAMDGVLFKKDKKTLLAYPPAKEGFQYVVPTGVVEIANNAFKNTKIETVSLPNTLKYIGEEAFYGSGLMYVTIPKNVEDIGNSAFAYCNKLDAVMVLNNTPPDIYGQTFIYSGDIMLFLDEANLNAYKNALYWRDFKWMVGFPTNELKEDLLYPTTIRVMDASYEYGDKRSSIQYKATGGYFEGVPQINDYAGEELIPQEYAIYIFKGTVSKKNLTLIDGTLTIKKAPLIVGVEDVTIAAGDAIPNFTLTYKGLKNNDVASSIFIQKPIVTTTATSKSPVGTYPVTVSGGMTFNYELSYTSGKLTITPSNEISDIPESDPTQSVYDLQGRRIEHVTEKGVYITTDGKKIYVK